MAGRKSDGESGVQHVARLPGLLPAPLNATRKISDSKFYQRLKDGRYNRIYMQLFLRI
jgi:hypothetical protein